MRVAPLLAAVAADAHATGGVATAVEPDEADLAGKAREQSVGLWAMARVLCGEEVVGAGADPDKSEMEVDLAVLEVVAGVAGEEAAVVAEVAGGRAARKGLPAAAAFEDFEVQPDGCHPNWHLERVEAAQALQVADC